MKSLVHAATILQAFKTPGEERVDHFYPNDSLVGVSRALAMVTS